nr:4-coumarate--CoA ligase 1-like [Danaus plexippus plexippus]
MLKSFVKKIVVRKGIGFSKMKHVWSANNIVSSPFEDVIIPDLTIPEHVWSNMHRWSDKIAIVCGVTERKYTYLQLYRKSQTLGANLRRNFGIKNGDLIAVMLSNIPEYPIITLGVLSAGGIVTTLNPIYTSYEVQRQLMSAHVKIIITSPENVSTIKQALDLNKMSTPIIVVDFNSPRPDGTISFNEIINDTIDTSILKEVKTKSSDVSLLLYSSGTTGLPKGVELTHRNIVANSVQQDPAELRHYDLTTESNQDTILAYLPMYHSYGMSVMMLHKLANGLKLVTIPKFQPETFIRILENYKINLIYLVPPTVLFLGSNQEVKSKHFEYLKYVGSGAAPSPKADIERLLAKFGHGVRFSQLYGLTEVSPLATISPVNCNKFLTVGFPLPNIQFRIVDDNDNNLGPGQLGELLIKGPNVMKGYRNNPEANKLVLTNGWFRTGDRAQFEEDGSLVIADRYKELIKVNAYQVAPAELESVIKDHPGVFDVAVVGIPDSKTGQKPKAFVVPNKNSPANEADIIEFVNKKVAPYKHIKEVQFIESIPKNPSGKMLRRLLLEK